MTTGMAGRIQTLRFYKCFLIYLKNFNNFGLFLSEGRTACALLWPVIVGY